MTDQPVLHTGNKTINHNIIENYFIPIFGSLIFLYTVLKAAFVSLTHDESIIYFMIGDHTLWDIFYYRMIPQDHMLNSFLVKLSITFFHDSEFFIRLPNLIGHFIYIAYSYLLVRKLKNPYLAVAAFIILNFNPYLLDFFSLARGYGLSVSMLMASVYYSFSFLKKDRSRYIIMAFLFATLSVLAVYSLLFYFAALTGWFTLVMAIRWIKSINTGNKPIVPTLSGLLVISLSTWFLYFLLADPLTKVSSAEFIHKGADASLLTHTIRSMAFHSTCCRDWSTTVDIISTATFIMFIISLVAILWETIKNKSFPEGSPLVMILVMLATIFLAVTFLNRHYDIRLLENRTSTFLLPLFSLHVILAAYELKFARKAGHAMIIANVLIAVVVIWNAGLCMNFSSFQDWKYDASTREMMQDLNRYGNEPDEDRATMGVYWLYEPSVNYYRQKFKMEWLKPVDRKGFLAEHDFYYVDMKDTTGLYNSFPDLEPIREYPVSNTILLRKK